MKNTGVHSLFIVQLEANMSDNDISLIWKNICICIKAVYDNRMYNKQYPLRWNIECPQTNQSPKQPPYFVIVH